MKRKEYVDRLSIISQLSNELPYKASVKRVLLMAPLADVEEVKHGKWVSDEHKLYSCSLCGRLERYKEPYCNCGAKMDYE